MQEHLLIFKAMGYRYKKLMHLQDGVRFNSNICHVFGANPTKDIRWIDVEI